MRLIHYIRKFLRAVIRYIVAFQAFVPLATSAIVHISGRHDIPRSELLLRFDTILRQNGSH